MRIDFDPEKSRHNELTRKLPFSRAADFDWEEAFYFEDLRYTYPERRFIAIGYLEERLHVLCFSPIQDGVRVISFRKANLREARYYYEQESING